MTGPFRIVWIGEDGRENIGHALTDAGAVVRELDRMVTEWRASGSTKDPAYQVERKNRLDEWTPAPYHVQYPTSIVAPGSFGTHEVRKLSEALYLADLAACDAAHPKAAREQFHCIAAMIRRACA